MLCLSVFAGPFSIAPDVVTDLLPAGFVQIYPDQIQYFNGLHWSLTPSKFDTQRRLEWHTPLTYWIFIYPNEYGYYDSDNYGWYLSNEYTLLQIRTKHGWTHDPYYVFIGHY